MGWYDERLVRKINWLGFKMGLRRIWAEINLLSLNKIEVIILKRLRRLVFPKIYWWCGCSQVIFSADICSLLI